MHNSREYEELEIRAERFRKNERILGFLTSGVSWLLFPIYIPYVTLTTFLHWTLGNWEMWAVLVPINAIWLLAVIKTSGRVMKYRVEDNEWAKLYSHLIAEDLEKRSKAKTDGLKREYQNEAYKHAKDFLSCIRKRWKIGSFKLIQDSFRKPLDELKKNLEYRVIPRLKDGNEEELETVGQIMRNLLYESDNLKLEDIISLNEQMSKLPTTEPLKIGFHNRLKNFLNAHKILKNVLVVSTFVVLCCVFYYLVVVYLEIAKEVVFGSTVVLFVGLITVYYRRQPRE
jgi:hypothetical protein